MEKFKKLKLKGFSVMTEVEMKNIVGGYGEGCADSNGRCLNNLCNHGGTSQGYCAPMGVDQACRCYNP